MALTEEQIKNLKPGDIVDIHGFVNLPLCDGNILVELRYEFDHRTLSAYNRISTEFISLPGEPEKKPKYDPCRLFRKGDIVRLKEWNGRCPALPENWKFDDGLFEVHVDEKFSSSVAITRENSKDIYLAPICFIELVTPVEELEPYSVEAHENGECECFVVMRGKQCVAIYPYGTRETRYYKKAEQAKVAAETECDRLNAEYRKNILK